MLKLSLPDQNNHYAHVSNIECDSSGGFQGCLGEEANARLSRNQGMTASFSRV